MSFLYSWSDHQGNLFHTFHIIWYQSFRLKIGYMFPLRFFSIWFLFIFIFLVFNWPRLQNSIFALFKILRGKNESLICVNECKKSDLKFLKSIHVRECCEVLRISITYFLQQSFTNRFEDESSWRSGEWYEPRDINHTICFN